MGSDDEVISRVETMLSAFELAIPCKASAQRALVFINGWFLSNASHSVQPLHIQLLREQDVNVELVALQAERERISTLKSSSFSIP